MPVRLRLRPLAAEGDACPIAGGPPGLALRHARLAWRCADADLDLRVLSAAPLPLPAPEPSEPVPGALARCLRAAAGSGAVLLLANPAAALGRERIALAEGMRLLGIATAADEACWDALLALGQPCYGVRGELVLDAARPTADAVLAALAFGSFQACEGLEPLAVGEGPRHVAWTCGEAIDAEILGRGGFPLATLRGASGRYDDRGTEGVVRAVLRGATGACWLQPRFTAPRGTHG